MDAFFKPNHNLWTKATVTKPNQTFLFLKETTLHEILYMQPSPKKYCQSIAGPNADFHVTK